MMKNNIRLEYIKRYMETDYIGNGKTRRMSNDMTPEEEMIVDKVIKEVIERYNYIPETLASFNEYERLLRLFKHWEDSINKEE